MEREPLDWNLDEGYLDLSHWILDALKEAGDTVIGRTQILPLLMGYASPKMDPSRYERGLAMSDLFELNYMQSEGLASLCHRLDLLDSRSTRDGQDPAVSASRPGFGRGRRAGVCYVFYPPGYQQRAQQTGGGRSDCAGSQDWAAGAG